MKKARFWLLVSLLVVARGLSYFLLKAQPAYVFVPRSFVGGGFQIQPALLDLIAPVIVILCLWPGRFSVRPAAPSWGLTIRDGLFLLLFPLLAGLSLCFHLAQWHIFLNLEPGTCLSWLQFVGAYVACNMLLDELPVKNRWGGLSIAIVLAVTLGPLQDTYRGMGDASVQLSISVGLTLTWTVLVLRRRYCHSPLAASVAGAIVGAISCLLVVMAPSDSMFPWLLPALALPLGAFAIRSERSWPRWAALAGVVTVGLFLSLALPRLMPPAERDSFLTQDPPPSHSETVDGVTVRYDDVGVREVALRLAHVLAAAQQISRETYGIAPQVHELVIRGFEAGGFEAEFPHTIRGNLLSQREANLWLDSSFLNDPNASIHFPDPVNGILHEFSHLYGTVPYSPWWKGAVEEEGWATFSATRLSRRLYERFGPSLWNPPYNYAARAEAITRTNLAGHAVYWSHPGEFAGFQLWYGLAQRDGEAALYRERWALTRRDYGGWWFQTSDPDAARKMAQSLGLADFVSFGSKKAVRYDQVYEVSDVLAAQLPLGQTAEEVRANYDRDAARLVDPAIAVPARRPLSLDIALSLILLVVSLASRKLSSKDVSGAHSVAPKT